MNDFLKDLIKSVDELDKASGVEAFMIVDDIKKKYNDHVEYLRENDFDRKSLMNELALCQYQLKECMNEANRLVEEYPTNLVWVKNSIGEAYQLWYSKNTIFYFEINEIKEDLYELSVFDKRSSDTTVSTHNSEYDCKRHAEKLYFEHLRKIYKQL